MSLILPEEAVDFAALGADQRARTGGAAIVRAAVALERAVRRVRHSAVQRLACIRAGLGTRRCSEGNPLTGCVPPVPPSETMPPSTTSVVSAQAPLMHT